MIEKLSERVNQIKENPLLEGTDESGTIQGIILPILSDLDWNIFDLEEVKPQFVIDGGRVDFAL